LALVSTITHYRSLTRVQRNYIDYPLAIQYSPGGLFYHYNLYAPYYNDQKKFPRVEVIYLRDRISVDLKTKVSIFRSHIDQPSRVAWNCGGHDDLPIAILHFVPITLTA
jgi:hypothetical protein